MQDYRAMAPDSLEREYSPSSMVGGDITGYLAAYAQRSAESRRQFPCRVDMRYGAGAQVLDFFPAERKGSPLFVFIHGGYWQELSHKDSSPMAAEVLEAGYAFAAVNYTIAPQGSIEQMVDEVGCALGFLQKNAGGLGLDAKRITLCGHSAGAHLAALQIMRAAPPFDPAGLKHLLLLSGIYDLEPIPLTSINAPLGLDEARARALSPMFLPPVARPGVTVAVAERDTSEFQRQSRDFGLHLGRHGLHTAFVLVPGRNHFDIIFDLGFAFSSASRSRPASPG